MDSYISYEVKNGIAYIILNDPATKNSLHFTVLADLRRFFEMAGNDRDIRCVVLRGANGVFSSGGNVNSMQDPAQRVIDGEVLEGIRIIRLFSDAVWAIRRCLKPVVCCIEGVAAGAAVSIALACDFRYAKENARLVFSFAKVGLMADTGVIALIKNLAGYQAATELSLTGSVLNAADAMKMGLINRVIPEEEFEAFTEARIRELAEGPTLSYAATKACLNAVTEEDFKRCIAMEEAYIPMLRESNDHKEGVRAFLEKRKPVFTNS